MRRGRGLLSGPGGTSSHPEFNTSKTKRVFRRGGGEGREEEEEDGDEGFIQQL